MKNLKLQLAGDLLAAIKQHFNDTTLTAEELASMLEYPPDTTMGDLALPCFRLSKALRRSPVQIAELIASAFTSTSAESVCAVNGYLNIKIDGVSFTENLLKQMSEEGENYGSPRCGAGKTVVLDYSSPNVAKPFHIGHLGTTVIGHSLKLLHEFAGYKCVGINYLGDWGTQFGKLIVAYRKWGSPELIAEKGIDALVDLYVKINNAITEHPEYADEAREAFRKLELGDKESLDLWQQFIAISLEEYEKTYKQLGISFDSYKGESFYTDKMPAQVQKLRDLGLLKIDDGASIVDLSDDNMPPCLILKRDGSTLYPTRDIAAAVYRKEHYHFDKAIYVTSNQQIMHFKQWFKVVEKMGYPWADELVHIPYGTVSINGSKLATRTGNVVLLRDLFNLAIDKVTAIMADKKADLKDRDSIAEKIGIGAIIFYYLSGNRVNDINFILEDALSFEGNTGPYVQYTYARTCTLLSKAGEVPSFTPTAITVEEKELAKTIARFPEQVEKALSAYEPSVITRYILDLCAAFNRFYHNCQILNAPETAVRHNRIALTHAVHNVLGKSLELICMAKTEEV